MSSCHVVSRAYECISVALSKNILRPTILLNFEYWISIVVIIPRKLCGASLSCASSVHEISTHFVAREEPRAAGEGVALEHTLKHMLGQNLDHAPAARATRNVPLHVPPAVSENRVELVRLKLIRREDAERARIPARARQRASITSEETAANWVTTACRSSPVAFMQLSCVPRSIACGCHSGTSSGWNALYASLRMPRRL
jgi:hypothetical protein